MGGALTELEALPAVELGPVDQRGAELRDLLDGDDLVVLGHEAEEGVEHTRLPGTGSPYDHEAHLLLQEEPEVGCDPLVEGADPYQVYDAEGVGPELPDAEGAPLL